MDRDPDKPGHTKMLLGGPISQLKIFLKIWSLKRLAEYDNVVELSPVSTLYTGKSFAFASGIPIYCY